MTERTLTGAKSYRIHATFVIDAASADDAEEAIRSASLSDDLTTRWHLERVWWTGEVDDE